MRAGVHRLILVSDAEPNVANNLAAVGESLDVTVLCDVRERVLERARAGNVDLVVLDIDQRDGLETLSLLKTGRSTKDIPVVAMAASDTADLRDLALEVGADGFIAKPLHKDTLPKLLTYLDSRLA